MNICYTVSSSDFDYYRNRIENTSISQYEVIVRLYFEMF